MPKPGEGSQVGHVRQRRSGSNLQYLAVIGCELAGLHRRANLHRLAVIGGKLSRFHLGSDPHNLSPELANASPGIRTNLLAGASATERTPTCAHAGPDDEQLETVGLARGRSHHLA